MTQTPSFAMELEKSAARLLHFGVSYGDWKKAGQAPDWDSWSQIVASMADQYDDEGHRAAHWNRTESAVELWRRAAVSFHYAQFKLPGGALKDERQARCRASYAKAAAWMVPPATRLAISFEGHRFSGYLRVPAKGTARSCVVLINGLDSAKEVELHSFADGFLRRGSAVFTWDGPGQGEGRSTMAMHRYSSVVSAVLDELRTVPELSPVPFALFGVSFGGFLACHAAASDPRWEAVVSLGGFHDARVLDRLPPPALANLRLAYGLAPDADVRNLRDVITLAPLREHLRAPLLIVHGTKDHLVDQEQLETLASWASPFAETRVYEDAEHVCTDRFPECLPMIWDWVGEVSKASEIPAAAWR